MQSWTPEMWQAAVIGLVVYAMFWGVANFLLPGGIYAGR